MKFIAALLFLALPMAAQHVDSVELVQAPTGRSLAILTDGVEVSLAGLPRNLSIKAEITNATDVDWRLQNSFQDMDYRRTDTTPQLWTLCSDTVFNGEIRVWNCSGLGYGGEYVLTITPYNGRTRGTRTTIRFTLTVPPKGAEAQPSVGDDSSPAQCPRGGVLRKTLPVELGTQYHYQCSNGAWRIELVYSHALPGDTEQDKPDRVFIATRTVCAEGAPRMVVYVGPPQNREATYVPVPDHVPAGAIIIDHCIRYETILCDDNNVCTAAP